ncbi:MAG: ABC transporter substrate-binding protein [Treponema sp.]
MHNYRLKTTGFFLSIIFSAVSVVSCTKAGMIDEKHSGVNGPIPDKVIYTVVNNPEAAIQAVIDGTQDIYINAVPKNVLDTLQPDMEKKLEVYAVSSDIRSLLLNPVPNKAPYTLNLDTGITVFNPFAVKEIRYALNWLINRRYLVDTVFSGAGTPMYTSVTPGQPGTCRYSLVPTKLGMISEGNELRALTDIERAMKAAAGLPENRGKLLKKQGIWYYEETPVTVKFVVRQDDPSASFKIARYVSEQLKKAGFIVELIEQLRDVSFDTVYFSDPAAYEWTLYTECWGEGATRRWWESINAQMYAPFWGNMPGRNNPDHWNYTYELLDKIAEKTTDGQYIYPVDYWNACLEVCKLGLSESVRVYLLAEISHFIAHKDRFNRRFIYGIGDGLNTWSIRTADIKPDSSGEFAGKKVLRVICSDSGDVLFPSPWDPVGPEGFTDDFSATIVDPCSDASVGEAPNNALDFPLLSYYEPTSLKTAPKINQDGRLSGSLPLGESTEIYDTHAKVWKRADLTETVAGAATGWLKEGYYWHNGCPVTNADVRYCMAFDLEWAVKDNENDPYFDPLFEDELLSLIKSYKGSEFNKNGSVTNYYNYYFAPDMNKTAASIGALNIKAGTSDSRIVIPWELYEAISELLAYGSIHGTRYSVSADDQKRISLIDSECIADIKSQLQKFIALKHIPDGLKGFISVEEALTRYKASIDFINRYNHAYISTGPFFISSIDLNGKKVIQEAVRKYPYDSLYWYTLFSQKMSVIQSVKTKEPVQKGSDAVYEIAALQFTYPSADYQPMSEGSITVSLQHEDGTQTEYSAQMISEGQFQAIIPAKDLAKLMEGLPYIVIIRSSIHDETASVRVTQFTL